MKLLHRILYAAAALFVSVLTLANRSAVTVSFDPISPSAEAWSIKAPLFLVILTAMFCGMLMGGGAVWLGKRKPAAQAVIRPATPVIDAL